MEARRRTASSNVIYGDFGAGRRSEDAWLLEMADRCEAQAEAATARVAASLRRCAKAYREKAARRGR